MPLPAPHVLSFEQGHFDLHLRLEEVEHCWCVCFHLAPPIVRIVHLGQGQNLRQKRPNFALSRPCFVQNNGST